MNIGSKVSVHGDIGVVKFIGQTEFAPGSWVGIELDNPVGKNDGSVKGVRYFECQVSDSGQYGIFVRPGVVQLVEGAVEEDNKIVNLNKIKDKYGGLGKTSPNRLQSPLRTRTPSSPIRSSRSPSSPIRGSPIRNVSGNAPVLLGPPPLLPPDSIDSTISRNTSPRRLNSINLFNTPGSGTMSTFSSPSRSPSLIDNPNLSRQVETLKSKLKIMERKRQEDREKLQFMQTQNKSVGRLENIIKRLQLKLTPMHEEIQMLRGRLAEVEEQNYNLNNEKNDEDMELAFIEKEIAEEKTENIMGELNALQRKFEQLEEECEILREENELYSELVKESEKSTRDVFVERNTELAPGDTNTKTLPSINTIVTLEKRNKSLEEALIKIRNINLSQESNYKEKIITLEQSIKDLQKFQTNYERLNEKLLQAEDVILDLKQQLDNSLGAEDMIESLTEQNLELSEKCEELKNTIDELETLRELNDELEANHSHREKQLSNEIDSLQIVNRENRQKLNELDDRNGNLELVIVKFKELVNNLNKQLSSKSTEQVESDNKDNTRAIIDLNLKLATSSIESKSRIMDLELYKFYAQQSLEHVNIVKCYLPNEVSNDEIAIESLFLIDRVLFESSVIYNYYKERLKESDHDDLPIFLEISLFLIEIQVITSKLKDLMKYSSLEKFHLFSTLYDQIKVIQEPFTSNMNLLKRGDISDGNYLKSLKECMNGLALLNDNYKNDDEYHIFMNIQLLIELMGELDDTRLSKVLENKRMISRLTGEWTDSRQNHNRTFTIDSQGVKDINKVKEGLDKVFRYIIKVKKGEVEEEEGGGGVGKEEEEEEEEEEKEEEEKEEEEKEKHEEVKEKVVDISDTTSDTIQSPPPKTTIDNLLSTFSISKIGILISKSTPKQLPLTPWKVKENQIKQLRSNQKAMDEELQHLKYEYQTLTTMLRTKDRNIEELDVKVGILNSKLAKSKEQDKLVSELKKSLSDSIIQGKYLNESLYQLKKTAKEQERILNQYKKSEVPGLKTGEILSAINLSSLSLQREVISLKSTISYLTKKEVVYENYDFLDPLPEYKNSHYSKLYTNCRPIFKNLRTAVNEYDQITFHIPEILWKSNKYNSKLIYFLQNEGLQIIKEQINNLI